MGIIKSAYLCVTFTILLSCSLMISVSEKVPRIYHRPAICQEGNVSNLHPDILAIPKCLEKWVDMDMFWRRPVVKLLWKALMRGEEIVSQLRQIDPQANTLLIWGRDRGIVHFQHAIKTLYPFLSIKMWFHLHFNSTTNLQLAFPGQVEGYFYNRRDTPWLDTFLSAVEPITGSAGITELRCVKCRNCSQRIPLVSLKNFFSYELPKIWKNVPSISDSPHKINNKLFLHSSDAHRISSIILNKDPCRYSHLPSETHLLAAPVVKVLDRTKDRNFVNIDKILVALKEDFSSVINSTFEEKSFQDQAGFMTDADIVIMAHGAAAANILFMKPCSVVVEYYPYGVCDEFFGPLLRGMDILHYVLHDTTPPASFSAKCLTEFENVGFQYNHSISQDICKSLETAGYAARQCRIRLPIMVDIQLLRHTLVLATADRLHCIDTHPLYNYHPSVPSN